MAGSSAAEPFWTQPAPREQAEAAAPQVHRGAGAVSVPQNAGSGPVRVSGRAAPRAQRPCGPGSCVGTEQAQERRLTGPWGLPPRAVHIFKSVSAAVLFACASRHPPGRASRGKCWVLAAPRGLDRPRAWVSHGRACMLTGTAGLCWPVQLRGLPLPLRTCLLLALPTSFSRF